jgi:hypothetical protein
MPSAVSVLRRRLRDIGVLLGKGARGARAGWPSAGVGVTPDAGAIFAAKASDDGRVSALRIRFRV